MIKIAVINLGKNVYAALSLNQELPLATIYRGTNMDSKREIESILMKRFHSQRNDYKAQGYNVPPLTKDHKLVGWKFIWKNVSAIWEKQEPEPVPREVILTKQPGLTVTKQVSPSPLELVAQQTSKELDPLYIVKKLEHGFNFEPVTEDVIPESAIPLYMRTHRD